MAVDEGQHKELCKEHDSSASSIEVVREALNRLGLPPDIVEKRLEELMNEAAIYNTRGNLEKQRELPNSIDNYINGFLKEMEGVCRIREMVNLFKELYSQGKLDIYNHDDLGRIVRLDGLGYEFLVLNLKRYNTWAGCKVLTKDRKYPSNFEKNVSNYEISAKGLDPIYLEVSNMGFFLPTENNVKRILKELTSQYRVVENIKKVSGFHDEDIAFFMLLTQIYGEFRLRNGVLKCYNKFRGFKWAKGDGTAQVLLLRKID